VCTRTKESAVAVASGRVLLVDDDVALGKVLGALLHQAGIHCVHVTSGDSALLELSRKPFEVVITDLRMPGMDTC
jgi:two-component system, NtrC family, response regulator AtoC